MFGLSPAQVINNFRWSCQGNNDEGSSDEGSSWIVQLNMFCNIESGMRLCNINESEALNSSHQHESIILFIISEFCSWNICTSRWLSMLSFTLYTDQHLEQRIIRISQKEFLFEYWCFFYNSYFSEWINDQFSLFSNPVTEYWQFAAGASLYFIFVSN